MFVDSFDAKGNGKHVLQREVNKDYGNHKPLPILLEQSKYRQARSEKSIVRKGERAYQAIVETEGEGQDWSRLSKYFWRCLFVFFCARSSACREMHDGVFFVPRKRWSGVAFSCSQSGPMSWVSFQLQNRGWENVRFVQWVLILWNNFLAFSTWSSKKMGSVALFEKFQNGMIQLKGPMHAMSLLRKIHAFYAETGQPSAELALTNLSWRTWTIDILRCVWQIKKGDIWKRKWLFPCQTTENCSKNGELCGIVKNFDANENENKAIVFGLERNSPSVNQEKTQNGHNLNCAHLNQRKKMLTKRQKDCKSVIREWGYSSIWKPSSRAKNSAGKRSPKKENYLLPIQKDASILVAQMHKHFFGTGLQLQLAPTGRFLTLRTNKKAACTHALGESPTSLPNSDFPVLQQKQVSSFWRNSVLNCASNKWCFWRFSEAKHSKRKRKPREHPRFAAFLCFAFGGEHSRSEHTTVETHKLCDMQPSTEDPSFWGGGGINHECIWTKLFRFTAVISVSSHFVGIWSHALRLVRVEKRLASE